MHDGPEEIGVDNTLTYFKSHIPPLISSAKDLRNTIAAISANDPASVQYARDQLGLCRNAYKKIEFFVEYFFGNQVIRFNLPPVFEVEEPTLGYQWTVGFQVIENLLFEEDVQRQKKQMLDNADVIILSAEGLHGPDGARKKIYELPNEQVSWVIQDLEANTNKDWVIAYGHQPPFTKGSHDSDDPVKDNDLIQIRANFIKILEDHGVDLILCGHSHVYERTKLLKGY